MRILVAEEDLDFIEMVKTSILQTGDPYHVEVVSSGADCLTKLKEEKFDILLLDHALPDGEGLEWLKRFNKMGIGIPTIFVTAKGDPKMSIEAMQEGVFDYINRSAECAKAFPFVVNRAIQGHQLMIEKVRLQKELIEARNFLESIIDNAGDAITVVDLEGKLIYWNHGAETIYGYRKEEVLGRRPIDFLFPQDEILKAREEKIFQRLMAQIWKGEVVANVEVKRQTKRGRDITVSVTLSPLKDASGRIIGVSRICKDITQMKKAEEKLLLSERLSCMGEMIAGVAHEIRNPLSGIKINTQILARKKEFPAIEKQILDGTLEGIEKIQKIVEDMLDYAKPRAAQYKREEINAIVERSLDVLKVPLKNANISTTFAWGEGLPQVKIDRHQIQQVLINIMLNAIHAMDQGGVLTVRTFLTDGGGVGIEVQDTGVGISEAHLKRIFDPFFTTKSRGTGLGLSISMKLLENHGALIDVTSFEGKGSVFTIRFPATAV